MVPMCAPTRSTPPPTKPVRPAPTRGAIGESARKLDDDDPSVRGPNGDDDPSPPESAGADRDPRSSLTPVDDTPEHGHTGGSGHDAGRVRGPGWRRDHR